MAAAEAEDAEALPPAIEDDPEISTAKNKMADERSFIELLRSKVVR